MGVNKKVEGEDNQPMVNDDENDEVAGFLSDDEDGMFKPQGQYVAGGGGIHRNLAAKKGNDVKKMHNADKYRGKGKNRHDVTKGKGDQPYAYIKLNSGVTNKRMTKKLKSKFMKEVGGIHKGGNKGGKAKKI